MEQQDEPIFDFLRFDETASPQEDASPSSLLYGNPFELDFCSTGSSEDCSIGWDQQQQKPFFDEGPSFLSMDDILCSGEDDASYKSPHNCSSTSTAPFACYNPIMKEPINPQPLEIITPNIVTVETSTTNTTKIQQEEEELNKREEEFNRLDAEAQKKQIQQIKRRISKLRIKNSKMLQEKESYTIKLNSVEVMKQQHRALEYKKFELCIKFWKSVAKLQQAGIINKTQEHSTSRVLV